MQGGLWAVIGFCDLTAGAGFLEQLDRREEVIGEQGEGRIELGEAV